MILEMHMGMEVVLKFFQHLVGHTVGVAAIFRHQIMVGKHADFIHGAANEFMLIHHEGDLRIQNALSL